MSDKDIYKRQYQDHLNRINKATDKEISEAMREILSEQARRTPKPWWTNLRPFDRRMS